jgi:type I restriction enzyme R subunit
MIYAARSLWEDPKLKSPTVILLVDREQFGDQMDRELNSSGTENVSRGGQQTRSGRKAARRLPGRDPDHGAQVRRHAGPFTQQRPNVIVMADEAHRTQERELGTYMRSALEGASMFGFTGTPIENDDHNTPKAWGYVKEDGKIERYMGGPTR